MLKNQLAFFSFHGWSSLFSAGSRGNPLFFRHYAQFPRRRPFRTHGRVDFFPPSCLAFLSRVCYTGKHECWGDIRFFGGYEIVLLYHWLGLAVKAHPVFLPFFSIPRSSPIFSHQCSRPKPAPRPSDIFIDSNGGPGIFYGKIPGKDLTSGNKCVTIRLQVQSHDLGGTYGS